MGAVEDAVDAAASFVAPFVEKNGEADLTDFNPTDVVKQALFHIQAINTADLAADPNAPYDASLAGIVYNLLDLLTLLVLVPQVSPGVAFSQRPKSTINWSIPIPSEKNESLLATAVRALIPILGQNGTGIQQLVSQRILPDIILALAELSLAPTSYHQAQQEFLPIFQKTLADTPALRILPFLTTLIQQPLPLWLKPTISQALALVPTRPQGIRHIVEFLSLAYLSKNSPVSLNTPGPQSQTLIPLEALTQASRLLVLPPPGITQEAWLNTLAPQLWDLLEGDRGKELSRAAGQIIASGILGKKSIGAPGQVGWKIFAVPLLRTVYPKTIDVTASSVRSVGKVIVQENDLRTSLRRISVIVSSTSHAGLLKRLIGPLTLPLWALLNHARQRSLLESEWVSLPKTIISQYVAICSDAKQISLIAENIFWTGDTEWTFAPGSEGGVEIRHRDEPKSISNMNDIFSKIADVTHRVNLLVSILTDADISDDVAGLIFVQTTERWLFPKKMINTPLTNEIDVDPLLALTNAKLSEALATTFKDKFARSPQHIIELMVQLVESFAQHQEQHQAIKNEPKKANLDILGKMAKQKSKGPDLDGDVVDEDLVSFALSILRTIVESTAFKQTLEIIETLRRLPPALAVLSQRSKTLSVSVSVADAARTLVKLINTMVSPSAPMSTSPNTLPENHKELEAISSDLTAAEPPDRTWALNAIRKLIQDPSAFSVVDVPSLTLTLLATSVTDPESYVHTAAIPVLVNLAGRAPSLVIRILVDAFVDTDEGSLKLTEEMQPAEQRIKLQHAIDFRLRVGEILDNTVLDDLIWTTYDPVLRLQTLEKVAEACLSLASRRGQRLQTSLVRNEIANAEQKAQEEGEAAWGGPMPNLFEPEGVHIKDGVEHDALLKIVQGWEDGGIEEDVRVRTSALSILSTMFEHRLRLLRPSLINASLHVVLSILGIETSEPKAILRRASVLVVMGLLRSLDAATEDDKESGVEMSLKQQEELDRVMRWVRDQDVDALTRDHAANVLEGMETLRMKRLFRAPDGELQVGRGLGHLGSIRGLSVMPKEAKESSKSKALVEEVE